MQRAMHATWPYPTRVIRTFWLNEKQMIKKTMCDVHKRGL
jgi:hypothetical protein